MATFENMRGPSDVLDASPTVPLVTDTFSKTPSAVSASSAYMAAVLSRASATSAAARENRMPDSKVQEVSKLSARPSTHSSMKDSVPQQSQQPSSASREASSKGLDSDCSESLSPSSRNGYFDDCSSPTTESKSRSSQHSGSADPSPKHSRRTTPRISRLPKEKTQYITSLKEELKKHNTIPKDFNKLGFFEELYKLLADDVWEIRNEATLLILDLLPYLKADLDSCLSIVLPNLVPNLGASRITLQKSTIQLLTTYASVSKDKEGLVEDLVTYGVNHKNKKVRKLVTLNVVNLLNEDFSSADLSPLTQALYRKVYDADVKPVVIPTLRELRNLVGEPKFTCHLNRISSKSRERLNKLLEGKEERENEKPKETEHKDDDDDDDKDVVVREHVEKRSSATYELGRVSRGWVEFGIVDSTIMEKIRHKVSTVSSVSVPGSCSPIFPVFLIHF